jgi:isoquinoline 1-oxidoreductase
VKVVRAVTAFECGAVVNPDQLKNQIEGALVMGLGGALFEAIEFKDGMITNPHLADYRVPRFSDAPKIEVVLVNRTDLASSGAGETPIVAIAPAIGNAICDASGIRLRSMPMVPDGLKVAEGKGG